MIPVNHFRLPAPRTALKPNAMSVEIAKPGKRAENKADKLRRITAAAHALFVEKGFDGTTMRDIAARAGVGFGTLFDYASNKRDLLFLLVNPELEQVLDDAIVSADAEAEFIDKLMAMFGGYYTYYAREKNISRIILRELTFFTEGVEALKFVDHRARFMEKVNALTRAAMADGQITQAPEELVGRIIFGLYAWEVRRWLATPVPSVARGLADLREMLELQLSGLKPLSRSDGRRAR